MAESTFEISKVQEVLRDLDSCRIPSLASPGSSSATFFPPSISRRFDRSRLYDVLRSIPSTEGRAAQLARDIVKRDCVKVFLILLRMDHPAMILHFLRNDTLSDRYLPLGRSENFPVGIQFDEFNDHQQPYCAPTIREGHVDFPNHRVLPLIGREELAQGGSAKVYKITIHPDFDGLDVDDEARIVDPNIYVAKVFLADQTDAFEREQEAYAKIDNTGRRDDSLLRHHGSFTYRGEHTVILEYANGRTWEAFMQQQPPERMEDKIRVWKGLLGLTKAVHKIHLASGWHQDVNPNNIILHMPEGKVRWPRLAKLVDLGHSFFAKGEESSLGRERFGTKDYGAPECYRSPEDAFELGTRRFVPNTIDVFSLGCVFLEAAVWFTDGPAGVRQFRDDRRAEARRSDMEEGIMCFHDDSELLVCVQDRLKSLGQGDSPHDILTTKICRYLIPGMIRADYKSRSEAEGLWKKAANILKPTRSELDAPGNDMTIPHLPDYDPNSADRLLTHPSCPENHVNAYKVDARSESASYVHNDLTQSPPMLSEPDSFEPADSLEEKPELRKAFTLPTDESAAAFLNGRSGSTEDAVIESSGRQLQSRANTIPANTSKQPDTMSSNRHHSFQSREIATRTTAHPGPSTQRPRMSMLQAKRFVEGKRDLSRHELELKKRLKDRDHSFILDNSHSASSHWNDICEDFRILASMVQSDDPDGIELRFTTSEECHQSRDVSELTRSASRASPGRGSDVEAALQKAVDQHVSRLKKRRTRLLSIYIMTDGNWEQGEPEAVLLTLGAMLEELGLNRSSLGVQFISYGSNEVGLKRLQQLDDMHNKESFDLKLDIVDTVKSDGNVWKMLLGSIDRDFDED